MMPTMWQCMLSTMLNSPDRILIFDSIMLQLKTFYWFVIMLAFLDAGFNCLDRPVLETEHVPPDAWREHRKSHHFLGPCCFCPLFQRLGGKLHYVEAAVYMVMQGIDRGVYIIQCAKKKCGYMGWFIFSLKIKLLKLYHSVPLERNYYLKFGVPLKRYHRRGGLLIS